MLGWIKRIFSGEIRAKKLLNFIQLLKTHQVRELEIRLTWRGKGSIFSGTDTFLHGAKFLAYTQEGKEITYAPLYLKDVSEPCDMGIRRIISTSTKHLQLAVADGEKIKRECRFIRITFLDQDGLPMGDPKGTIDGLKLELKKINHH